MKAGSLLRVLAVAAVLGLATFGSAPAASAAGASMPAGETIPATTLFGGSGTGPTAETAFENAATDATAQATAAGFTNCAIAGDPVITGAVRPGFPVIYRALVTIGCTA